MGNTGFDTPFYIRRKRNVYSIPFLLYLDGRESEGAVWPDSDGGIEVTNNAAQLAPYGYLPRGESLDGNLGVDGDTITAFTIAVILSRDEMTNDEGIVYGMFGSTHYPRLYFDGADLIAEVKLDGNVKTATVSNADTYLKKGQPSFIVLRGSAAAGIDILIDGVIRATQTDTGTAFSVGTGDFSLAMDGDTSDAQIGALRFVAVCAQKLTETAIATWRIMLEYEGFFDPWRDNFAKWSGSATFTGGVNVVPSSPYVATIVEA